jgi:hypothetical protein
VVYIAGWSGVNWLITRPSRRSRVHRRQAQGGRFVPDLNESSNGRVSLLFYASNRDSIQHYTNDYWESDDDDVEGAARQSSRMTFVFSVGISLAAAGSQLVWSKTKIKGQDSMAQETARSVRMPFFIPKSADSLCELG